MIKNRLAKLEVEVRDRYEQDNNANREALYSRLNALVERYKAHHAEGLHERECSSPVTTLCAAIAYVEDGQPVPEELARRFEEWADKNPEKARSAALAVLAAREDARNNA